jgi:hypothetical protein
MTMHAVRALQQSFDRAYTTERALEQLRTLARARTVASLGSSCACANRVFGWMTRQCLAMADSPAS